MAKRAHVNFVLVHGRSVYLRNFAIMVAVESATSVARRFAFCTQCSGASIACHVCQEHVCEHSDPNTAHVTQFGGSEAK